jgi:hypothetical protein
MVARLVPLFIVTLAVGCVRPPTVDGATCPCPDNGYTCDLSRGVCVAVPGTGAPPPPSPMPDAGVSQPSPLNPPPDPCAPGGAPYLPRRLVRLTPVQLARAIQDLTGYAVSPDEIPDDVDPARRLAIEIEQEGFSATVSPETALILADVARRAAMSLVMPASCTGATVEPACLTYLIKLDTRANHRVPSQDEIRLLESNADADAATLGAEGAVRLAVEVILQSPQFLYRTELGSSAGGPTVILDNEELASALAFVYTDGPPDEELIAALRDLGTPATRQAQAARLRDTPAGREKTLRFLAAFADIARPGEAPGETGPSLAITQDMLLETRSLFRHVLDGGGRLEELIGADYTFVTAALADHYGIMAPPGAMFPLMVNIPARIGLFNQGSFLVAHAPGPSGLPSARGVALSSQLFCAEIPPPPPDLPMSPPNGSDDLPVRERYTQLVEMPPCMACHALFDPLGLGLENFDGLGRFRSTQGGKPIDTSIDDPFNRGDHYRDTVDLARKTFVTPAGQACFADHYLNFALGGVPSCATWTIESAFTAGGGRLPALLDATAGNATFAVRGSR